MPESRPYRKFSSQQDKIDLLGERSPRFKRIFTEYESLSDSLWVLESSDISGVPDDFLESIKMQAGFLEEEIEDLLSQE